METIQEASFLPEISVSPLNDDKVVADPLRGDGPTTEFALASSRAWCQRLSSSFLRPSDATSSESRSKRSAG